MNKNTLLMLMIILCACSHGKNSTKISEKELIKKQKKYLKEIRPLLQSDEFHYMKCSDKGSFSIERNNSFDIDTWKSFGLMEIREEGLKRSANIMTLTHILFADKVKFMANYFSCENINRIGLVDGPVGMCGATEERLFNLKYPDDETRELGQEMIKQKIRYYGLTNHFTTYSFQDISYKFTKKEYEAKASFFRCK